MKILLLKSHKIKTTFAPLGLGYIGAVLERAGHDVQIRDLSIEKVSHNDFCAFLSVQKPDAVGISSLSLEFDEVLKIASICKKRLPASKIILGGPMASSIPDILLRQSNIDIVVMGEGEISIVETIKRLENNQPLEDVKGIAFNANGVTRINPPRSPIIDLDTLPFPAYHLLKMENYISSYADWYLSKGKSVRAATIIGSRGCPYRCIFCDKSVFGNKWRARSAGNIVDEIELLVNRYSINGIIFNDDVFDLNKKWVFNFCDEIINRDLKIVWNCNSRINHANKEMYQKMYESGCRYVAFGIEFGNQKILDFAQKDIALEQMPYAIKTAKTAGLNTGGSFMIGMLSENKKTICDTIELAKSLPLERAVFGIVVPMFRTKLYDLAAKEGLIKEDDWGQWDRFKANVSLTHDLSRKQLETINKQVNWESFWHDPSRRVPRVLCKIASKSFPVLNFIFKNHLYEVSRKIIQRFRIFR